MTTLDESRQVGTATASPGIYLAPTRRECPVHGDVSELWISFGGGPALCSLCLSEALNKLGVNLARILEVTP